MATIPSEHASSGEDALTHSPFADVDDDPDYVPDDDQDEANEDDQDENDQDRGDEVDANMDIAGDIELLNPRIQSAIRDLLGRPESDSEDLTTSALLSLSGSYGRRTRAIRTSFGGDLPEDDDTLSGWSRINGKYKDSREPSPQGVELLKSGEFGRISPAGRAGKAAAIPSFIHNRSTKIRRMTLDDLCRDAIPNTHGTVVATYCSKAYVGQFSTDSSIYYTCTQDFDLHIYDATRPITPLSARSPHNKRHATTMKVSKSILGMEGQWTVTDSHLSPDNSSLIYSSLGSTIYLTKTQDATEELTSIKLGDRGQTGHGYWYGSDPAIYSCRFSTDNKEIVAGGSQGGLYVYDLGAMRRTLRIDAHDDDVNSCCWADTTSGNVLVSASDDTTLKVWDRRSLGASHKPSGVLIGHTEGITHVGPKGDGRYVISNGKDQILRLWDLRKMRTHNEWDGSNTYGHRNYDYRHAHYPKPRHRAHPKDTSVMTYKGHAVLRTLIRCHFSPAETTGNSYIYSGSYDGMIHVWSLDGRVVQVLDRSKTTPITFDPSAPDPGPKRPNGPHFCVRDVSWHGLEPVIMSCAWESDNSSSVARHEWKGYGKNAMTIEDVLERDELNAAHAAQMTAGAGLARSVTSHS